MSKSSRIVIAVVAVILIAVIATKAYKGAIPTGGKQTVKIGLSLPLTGAVAFLGESAKMAAELALKDAGNTKYNYDLVFEDDQFNAAKAASAASKLINIDKALAIISFGSGTGNAINPIAEAGNTTQFALAADPTAAKGDYNFIHYTPSFKGGEALAKELIRKGIKSISIVDTNHPGTMSASEAIKKSLEGTSVKIVSYDLTNIGDKEFKTVILKIKQAKPEMVVLEMFSPEIEIAYKEMKELGVNLPVTSVYTIGLSKSPDLFEGSWYASTAESPIFAEKFKTAYNIEPLIPAPFVYDLVSMLINIQEKSAAVIAPKDLPAIIHQIGEWDSPIYGKLIIDKDGFFLTEAIIKMIQGGKSVLVK